MNKNRNKELTENPYQVFYDNYMDTNAGTECTGLIPEYSDGREEWDEYHEIFEFTPWSTWKEEDGTEE